MNLRDQLREAETAVAVLRQRIAGATCAEAGHDMRFIGGRNALCGKDCKCSIPVHECANCGDCDYGENSEADHILVTCEARHAG